MADPVALIVEGVIAIAGGAGGTLLFLGKALRAQTQFEDDHKATKEKTENSFKTRDEASKVRDDQAQARLDKLEDRIKDLEQAFDNYNQRDRDQWNNLNRTLGQIEGGLGLRK